MPKHFYYMKRGFIIEIDERKKNNKKQEKHITIENTTRNHILKNKKRNINKILDKNIRIIYSSYKGDDKND